LFLNCTFSILRTTISRVIFLEKCSSLFEKSVRKFRWYAGHVSSIFSTSAILFAVLLDRQFVRHRANRCTFTLKNDTAGILNDYFGLLPWPRSRPSKEIHFFYLFLWSNFSISYLWSAYDFRNSILPIIKKLVRSRSFRHNIPTFTFMNKIVDKEMRMLQDTRRKVGKKGWERKFHDWSCPLPEIVGKWESATTTFPFAHYSIDRGETDDLRHDGWTKAIFVNGDDKTCRSSMFYPILLLLNVNSYHISFPRDFDTSWKSVKISSYNSHRLCNIHTFLFNIFIFTTVVKSNKNNFFCFSQGSKLAKMR